MNNDLIELPINIDEKYDILKRRFIGEEDKYIKYLSGLPSLIYLTNQPSFAHYYIKDEKILSKSVASVTLKLESIKINPFPECFVLYGFQSMNGVTYVRGSYIEYNGETHRKMRDAKIDKIIVYQI